MFLNTYYCCRGGYLSASWGVFFYQQSIIFCIFCKESIFTREGGVQQFDGLLFLQYLIAFLAPANVAWCIFATPYCTFAGSKSGVCRFCSTVHHFCLLSYASEADLQYLTAFWHRPRAILQYLTAFLAPSKFRNTLQHSGPWGPEFAIPYCI